MNTATASRPSKRIYLVEDSELIRERLLAYINNIPGISVIGQTDNAGDAIEGILSSHPDAVVLDLGLKNSSGIAVLRAAKQWMPDTKVIVLTNYATASHRRKCMEAGAEYFLDKTNEFQSVRGILEQLTI